MHTADTPRGNSEARATSREEPESLGDGVYVADEGGMIRLSGSAFDRQNVIFLEPAVYRALHRWAQAHGYYGASRDPLDEALNSGDGTYRP